MYILVTGGTGFIGSALVPTLIEKGWSVTVLSRQHLSDSGGCRYIRALSALPADTPIDAIINLAGASLAARRWTDAYKREIVDSRLDTTRDLLALIERLDNPPKTLLSASAIGYYGHHGDERLAEDAPLVAGFSQDLCQRWEECALQAPAAVRVCLLRLGVVLGPGGGALQEMLRSFQFGVASWLGSGEQWLSWVHRDDVVAAIVYLLEHAELSGPFNITAPEAVTARGFSEAVKEHKRTILSAALPAPVARLMLGEMADELLLNGQRVVPSALQQAGFEFAYPRLSGALADILAS